MKLLLFRHGLTAANEAHVYCGKTDLPLSDRGREALRALRSSGGLPSLEGFRVLTSGALRCQETLLEFYGPVPFEVEPRLREMDFGDFEMRGYEELKNDLAYIAWIAGDNEANVTPHGESGNQMRRRVLAALERLLADARPAALFTHGGPIAAIMQALFPEEQKTRYQWQPAAGGGYEVDTENRRYEGIFGRIL